MVASLAAPAAPALTGAVLCAVSLAANAGPLAIKLPKIEMPKVSLPGLPKFGGGKSDDDKKAAPKGQVKVRPAGGIKVQVRAAGSQASVPDAPTLADITGEQQCTTVVSGAGWKRFPGRRMPGANMDRWKQISQEIGPSF